MQYELPLDVGQEKIPEEIVVAFWKMLELTITGLITLLAANNLEDEEKGWCMLEEAREAGKVAGGGWGYR